MKITACCCTYCRPDTLAEMLWCFEKQDYPDRELVILDDAGQYKNQEGDRWRLISSPGRYTSLGEKRNATVRLASSDSEYIAIWDDDDLYLPWALSAVADALDRAEWCRPSIVLEPSADKSAVQQVRAEGFYHGAWGFRRTAWEEAGGYPSISGMEDKQFGEQLVAQFATECDPMSLAYAPYYVYRFGVSGWSVNNPGGYGALEKLSREPVVLSPRQPQLPMTMLEDIRWKGW